MSQASKRPYADAVDRPVCEVPGCARGADHAGRGQWLSMCSPHRRRKRRYGDPLAGPPVRDCKPITSELCDVPDCAKPHAPQRRYCYGHFDRRQKTGVTGGPLNDRAPNGSGHINSRGYRVIYVTGHPLAAARGWVFEQRAVLFDKLGPQDQQCHWCQTNIRWSRTVGGDSITADHLDGDVLNNDPDNLVAACNSCNPTRASLGNPTDWTRKAAS